MISRTAMCLVLIALTNVTALRSVAKDPPSKPDGVSAAKSLVRAALQAETNDDAALRESLLKRALSKAPDYPPARWHSGYVREEGEWLKYDDVWQRTSDDKRLMLYRQMRNRANNVDDHVTMARWCRKSKLDERENLHWMYVLAQNPSHNEALRALGLRQYHGSLMTDEEIAEFERLREKTEEANARWNERLQPIGDAILGDNPAAKQKALAELRQVNDPEAIPVLMRLARKNESLAMEVIAVLRAMPDPPSTVALARLALFARHEAVRVAAAQQLGQRPMHDYVPMLLAHLQALAEINYYVTTFLGGIHLTFTVEQEGPKAHFVSTTNFFGGPRGIRTVLLSRNNQFVEGARRLAAQQRNVVLQNQQAQRMNKRAIAALKEATKQDLKNEPRAWWNWWAEFNELHVPKQKIVNRQVQYIRALSCFVAGTQVWTETGPQPIETIRIGDRVLSQDCDTGELAYKLVTQTTLRPPSKTQRLEVGGEEIWTTLGHPFWAVGEGWLMAKQLEQGSLLHSVSGPLLVDNINPGPETNAHNLVVADFNTYFVGQAKVLVHDNQPRSSTRAVVPGYVAK